MTTRLAPAAFIAALLAVPACAPRQTASPFAAADSLREEGLPAQAFPLYLALRDSLRAAGDSAGWWRAEAWLSQVFMRLGRLDSADAAVTQAAVLARGDTGKVGWTHAMRCNLWSRRGQADSAIAECDRGLEAARAARDGALEARLHFHLGTIHSRRGRFRLSVAETERALDLERRYGSSRYQLAGVLNSMGIEYAAAGRLTEAEAHYQEGVRLARTFGAPWYAAYLASNLAYLRATSGDVRGALEYMTEAFRSAQQVADTQTMVYALNSTAEFYQRSGNRPAARAALERAGALNQRVLPLYRLITLIDLGLLDLADARLGPAEDALRGARELADASDYGLQGVQTRVGLSGVALARSDPVEALRWADDAVRIADSLASPEVMIDALAARARAREAAGREDAAAGYLAGIDLLESWRGRLALGDLAIGVADPRWDVYEGAIRVLLARGSDAEAFSVAERGRARFLLNVMAERDASRPASSREVELGRRLRQRSDERAATEDPEARHALDREIQSITDSLTLAGAPGVGDSLAAARNPAPSSLDQIRQRLAGPGRSFLSYFWGDSAVYGWSLSPTGLRAARLGRADSLEAQVTFLTSALSSGGTGIDWRIAAARLFESLVSPLGPVEENVVVVADGPLARLPLEALIRPDGQPLGATHLVTYTPSASVSLALALARTPTWRRGVLAVGNPAPSGSREPGPYGLAFRGRALEPLPLAETEARSIYRLFRAQGSDLLLGRRASPERWNALDPARYRYLHFAAHAVVDDRRPERTGIALAGGDLTLGDIRRESLSAELVTLSACETALGREVRGEGVIGLPHAFLSAGARGVVVTLWRVRDRDAADFMSDLYGEIARGIGPAAALRSVRRAWMESNGPHAEPRAWAPWVLVGQ